MVLDELNPAFYRTRSPIASSSSVIDRPVLHCGHLTPRSFTMALNAEADGVASEHPRLKEAGQGLSPDDERNLTQEKHVERILDSDSEGNLVYDDVDEEPEIHARTYIALAAMCLLNLVQVVALQGPPAVVRDQWRCLALWT